MLAALLVGVAVGIIAGWVYRRRIQQLRNRRTRRQLASNRVSTVAQVLHFAIQSAPDAVAVVDKRRNVVLSNPRAHELGLVHERDLNTEVWSVVEQVLEDHEPRPIRFTPPRRRGNRPVVSVAGQVKLLSLADDRYVVAYATDDSEHVRMESARRDFVANVSHELKTPVGAISLLVETMMEVHDDPDAVQYFGGKLVVETQRMNQMITELISLSKLQGAESLPNPDTLSVDAIVEEAIDRCRLAAEAMNIELVKDSNSHALVKGDRGLLVTSLSNLITNAIHYSPEGSPVSISREVSGDFVVIRVTDRGIGIAPEDQKRVFERFFRVDKARSRNTGGTGLGLAIVKHVMVNHGGSVSLWSRPGTGSTFTLELPRTTEGGALPTGVEGDPASNFTTVAELADDPVDDENP
ncbi:MAG TPA: two-component sensor histidine kinase [Candidatus Corynebacterium gallistercoris]|uniref:Sensor-like histidine kinase SenX3 n=1 Tax=Candidatus Corynebacterium gallistercoris TaxID=2838530 RepID=A0A9D1RWA8_9CORY|nr:two-component sensor histidine kinase [Candidatus Corynebacterium gallistercoris]